jgi:hypothetical protein
MRALWLVGLLALSCGGRSPNVVIHAGRIGEKSTPSAGTELEVRHVTLETQKTIPKRLFTAMRSANAWQNAFVGPPPMPQVDFTKQMLLFAAAQDTKADSLAINHVIVTDRGIMHVYVDESFPGEGCAKEKEKEPPMDIAVVDRIADEVHFWIDRRAAPGCGGKPKARLVCKVEGSSEESDKTLKVQPGAKIVCDSQLSMPGAAGSITDRAWALTERPFGSTAMMSISKDRMTSSFVTDAFGKYTVRLQVSDQEAKGDEASLIVDVATPKDGIVLEMGWTKFDRNDEVQGFPRVEMLAAEVPAPLAKSCDPDVAKKPAWCAEALRLGTVTHLRLAPQEKKRYRFGVKYIDERLTGPVLCTRVFVLGAKLTETCDDTERKAGSTWDMGVLNMETGQFDKK